MDTEFSWTQGPHETNSITATMVTKLRDAEEAAFRELLAKAWDEGHEVGRKHPVSGHWNPYRD